MVEIKNEVKDVNKAPKSSGFFIASWLWFVAVLFFYLPDYYGEVAVYLVVIFTTIGWLLLSISLIGISIELSSLIKNEGLSYWGASLAFFLPALALHFYQYTYIENILWINILKTVILLMVIIGSGMFFYGVSYFFEKPNNAEIKEKNKSNDAEIQQNRIKRNIETFSAILVALLTITTALLQLRSVLN